MKSFLFIISLLLILSLIYKIGQDKEKFFNNITKQKIPKVIISTYHNKKKIPKKIEENIMKYAPNYRYIVYDDNEIRNFLRKYYSKNVLDAFNELKGAHKADLFRYCYLYKFGGVYLDIKTELIKNIDSIFNMNADLYTVFSINKNTIYQGIIVSSKKNPIFKKLISYMIKINKPVKNYLIFTYDFFKKLKESSIDNKLKQGLNKNKNGSSFYLFNEKCTKNPSDCKDKLDRHGLCCYVYDKGKKIIKSRYSDYPW